MRKTTKKIILISAALLLLLAGAFWWGGDAPSLHGVSAPVVATTPIVAPTPAATPTVTAVPTPTVTPESTPKPVKDNSFTDTAPTGKPAPVDTQQPVVTEVPLTCTLSVRCDTLLDHLDSLDEAKRELVPADGVVFPETEVTFYAGETVFNVLQREMKRGKIHLEFTSTPLYHSAYIEGIQNLYEFDCGELSGWTYKVNSWFPNYGCSRYELQQGDKVEWVYTCDRGGDVGGYAGIEE
ncbi:MAG: DUF4430 domain-containing protein [Oscillospiraceae bacterium]